MKLCVNIKLWITSHQQAKGLFVRVRFYFYICKLHLQCFDIHDIGTRKATFYLYSEHFAHKGPNEVISALNDFLTYHFRLGKELVVFCDNAFAQNKNKYLVTYLWSLTLNGSFTKITVNYPLPGHSFLPCDTDFANVEKLRRTETFLYSPQGYINLFRRAKPTCEIRTLNRPLGDSIDVVLVCNYKDVIERLVSKKSVNIREVRGILLTAQSVKFCLAMNTNAYFDVKLLARGVSVATVRSLRVIAPAYHDYLPIKPAKLADIRSLLEFVPAEFHGFYRTLHVDFAANDAENETEVE